MLKLVNDNKTQESGLVASSQLSDTSTENHFT